MDDTLDPRLYSTVPRFDVGAGVALGRAMLTAAPAAPNAIVKREIARCRAALGSLEGAWQPISADATPTSEKRAADKVLDGTWGALDMRLAAWNRLPAGAYPEVARATSVRGALFPDGLVFLTLAYTRQWAESQRRLDHIDTNGLAADIDTLCGPAFLGAVRAAHARYGVVLGITEAAPEPGEVPASVREPFIAFRTALTRYVQKLVGTLDDEDAAAVAAVKAALRPLDDHRATAVTRGTRSRGKVDAEAGAAAAPEQTN